MNIILWGIALVATSGSLFFSTVLKFIPCELCWYQRILMYPLVIIFLYSIFQNKIIQKKLKQMSLFFIIPGMLIAGFHYILQKLPKENILYECQGVVPCSGQYINWFGFVTIPFLSFVSFTLLFILILIDFKKNK